MAPSERRGPKVIEMPESHQEPKVWFSMEELAERWRCSRGTVYNRLRSVGAEVLDFAPRGKRGKKIVRISTVLQIEQRKMKRLY